MTNDLTFGQFISEQRQKHSMESQELAKALGISGAYLSCLLYTSDAADEP